MRLEPFHTHRGTRSASRRRLGAILVGGAVLSLALAACSGDSGAGQTSEEPGEETTVVISLQRTIDSAPVVAGIEEGFFSDRGIDLQLAPAELGGPAAVPSLINGEIQLTNGSGFGYLVAVDAGQPLQLVAPLSFAVTAEGEESSGVAVKEDSDIQSIADLKGKTIAVAALNGLQSTALGIVASEAGLTAEDYQLVELPVPNISQAVLDGQVDAGYIFEPLYSAALDQGLRELATPVVDVWGGEPPALIIYGESGWVADNADTVEAFVAGLNESLEWANANREEFVKIAAEFTEIPIELVEASRIPEFRTELDVAAFTSFGEQLVDLGVIGSLPDSRYFTPAAQ